MGLYQEFGDDAPDIEEVQELVGTLTSADIGEVELLDADGNPVEVEELKESADQRTERAAERGGLDMTDPLLPGLDSTSSGPLSLPNLESDPTTLKV